MNKEIKFYGYIYLPMKNGESEKEAESRFERLLEASGIILGDHNVDFNEE